jgi:putative transposase
MKGSTMLATMQTLGVIPSFSRPGVSDDNPFSESLFRTLKYCSIYPERPFKSLHEARKWVDEFVHWYNNVHLHSGIKYVTPASRHDGGDEDLLANRDAVYQKAREKSPQRWAKETRNWTKEREVILMARKECAETKKSA